MASKSILHNRSGLTLIEILIAITLLSFIMFGVISVTTDSLDTKNKIVSEDREYLDIETAFARMDWDFSHIYSPLAFARRFVIQEDKQEAYAGLIERLQMNRRFNAIDADGRMIPVLEANDASTFEFFTSGNRRRQQDQKQSNFAWVRYSLGSEDEIKEDGPDETSDDDKSGTKVLLRHYSANNPYDNDRLDISKIKAQALVKDVEDMKIRFWDPVNKKFQDSLDMVQDGLAYIRAIQVEITLKDKNGIERKDIRILRSLFPLKFVDPDDTSSQEVNLDNNEEEVVE